MNIDVVLTTKSGVFGAGRVLTAATAQQLVQQIRSALGPTGRIDRLRIIDSFDGPDTSHPLRSITELAMLRGLFSPQGSVEIAPGPIGLQQKVGGTPTVAGFQGGFGGQFGGAGKLTSSISGNTSSLLQISSVLGVPVRSARG